MQAIGWLSALFLNLFMQAIGSLLEQPQTIVWLPALVEIIGSLLSAQRLQNNTPVELFRGY